MYLISKPKHIFVLYIISIINIIHNIVDIKLHTFKCITDYFVQISISHTKNKPYK